MAGLPESPLHQLLAGTDPVCERLGDAHNVCGIHELADLLDGKPTAVEWGLNPCMQKVNAVVNADGCSVGESVGDAHYVRGIHELANFLNGEPLNR